MSNATEKKLPAQTNDNDGFANNDDGSDRLLHGRRIVFIDGEWTLDEVAIPPGKQFLATGTAEGIQHWQDGQLVEELIKKPNVSLPNVKELNATIPQSEWDEGRNGPRPPYAYVWAVYLLDEKDGRLYPSEFDRWRCDRNQRSQKQGQVEASDEWRQNVVADRHTRSTDRVEKISEVGSAFRRCP